jgi:hypothetical protein
MGTPNGNSKISFRLRFRRVSNRPVF